MAMLTLVGDVVHNWTWPVQISILFVEEETAAGTGRPTVIVVVAVDNLSI